MLTSSLHQVKDTFPRYLDVYKYKPLSLSSKYPSRLYIQVTFFSGSLKLKYIFDTISYIFNFIPIQIYLFKHMLSFNSIDFISPNLCSDDLMNLRTHLFW